MEETETMKRFSVLFAISLALICIPCITSAQGNAAPTFSAGDSTTLSVAENTAAGEAIGSAVAATDTDTGDTLTYTLGGTDASSFDIVSTSGQLQTKDALDYETGNSYEVTVSVSDSTDTDTITVTINVTNVNEAPTFPDTTNTTLEVTNHTPVGTNIDPAVSATDPDVTATNTDVNPEDATVDALTYTLGGTDASSFDIDAETGQLRTVEGVAFDRTIQSSYSVTVTASDGEFSVEISVGITVVLTPPNERTPQVREAIVDALSHRSSIDDVTLEDLSRITNIEMWYLYVANIGDLTALQAGDFGGFTEVTRIAIRGTNLTTLPEGLFSGLTKLQYLQMGAHRTVPPSLNGNELSELPEGIFAGLIALEELNLGYNNLSELPSGIFAGLTALRKIFLDRNELTTLPEGLFSGLTVYGIYLEDNDLGEDGLPEGLFDGATVWSINLSHNGLSELPSGIFDGLTTLYGLNLGNNDFSALPEGIFDGLTALTSLELDSNDLSVLPAGIFDELTALERFYLNDNLLTTLPAGIFDKLTALEDIDMEGNELSELPAGIFDGLTALKDINLKGNVFSTLPEGIFGGLTALTILELDSAQVSSFRLPVSIEEVDGGAFKATAPTGAPFPIELSLTITKGTPSETTVTIPTGALESDAFVVVPTPGETIAAVNVDIDEPLPSIPSTHNGYNLVYKDILPPNVSIMVPTGVQNGEFEVTVVFNEEVRFFEQIGLFMKGTSEPSIAEWNPQEGGTDYKATITTVRSGTAIFEVATSRAADFSHNLNTAAEQKTVNILIGPTFSDGDSTTRAVNENTAAGENIGTPVAATDPDSDDTLTYTLGGTDASSFDIDAETGQLQTKAELDYETDDSYTVTVSVSDGNSGTDAIDVTIEVTNVNEAPKFATTTATRSIAENTAAGIDIGEPVAATDPDVAGTNTDVNPDDATVDALTYTLGGTDTASFAIDSDTGQLETKVALDYETKDSYEVTVTASDGGTDTASITVTINITDVNEDVPNSAPTFTAGDSTTRSVAENTAAGEDIGSAVAATDTDIGDTLTYTLGGTDASSFAIVSTSGQLQTKDALDYETDNSYEVTVSVSDSTDTDTITVTISVTNVNEAPKFATTTTPRSIAENTAASTDIGAAVSATDPDGTTDVNPDDATVDALTYTLGGDPDAASFDIDSETGQLETKVALDYETKDTYEVTVTASDGGTDTVSITVTINITNVNEAPKFATTTATRSIAENTAAGTAIGEPVSATDPDGTTDVNPEDDNVDALTYTLGVTDAASFAIDSDTGQLETKVALDYETKDSYEVTVTASDGGTDTASITVAINITTAPTFTDGASTTRSVAENTAAGEAIGSAVAATDADSGNTLTYTLGGDPDAASFTIVSTSGQLQTKDALDYETKDSYEVTVTASDDNDSTDAITVTINVTNVNEAPTFPGTGTTATRSIAENTGTGENIGAAVSATDPDGTTDVNPTDATVDALTYTLGGTDAALFAIDADTGQLQTVAGVVFDRTIQSSYSVTVTASDGEFMVTISVDITVVVTPVCDRTPQIRAAIIAAVPGVTDCADVTETHLAAISTLNVSSQGITALKAGDFDGLTTLITLDLKSNLLSELPAGVFDELTALTTLNLRHNRMMTLPADVFDELTALTNLNLNRNQISELRAEVFDKLTALTKLYLDNNQMMTLREDVFDKLTALTTLSLNANQLSELPAGVFDELTALTTLFLNNNQMMTLREDVFDKLTVLTTLFLNNNLLSELPADVFDKLTALTSLSLGANLLSELPADVFDKLTALTALSLSDNLLSALPAEVFKGLTALTELYLSANLLSELPADVFDKLTALTSLSLSDNLLSALPAEVFKGLTALTELYLSENTVDPLPVTVSLKKGAEGAFKATAHTGAPFAIALPVTVTSGTLDGDATTITVPIGDVESDPLTVTRTAGTTAAVTVDIGTLPDLPSDHQGYALVKSADLPLEIFEDVSNAAPTFTAGDSTTLSVAENTAAGEDIGSAVAATDTDTGDTLTYTLGGTDASSFDIVSTSGQLQTKSALDYETKTSYTVTVTVSDSTDTDSITVTISVTNVNEAPTFPGTTATRSIAENTGTGENIGAAVSATDPDVAGTNTDVNPEDANVDALTYTLGGTDAASFDIVSTSGQLQTKDALDYETDNSYTVTVSVSDGTDTDTITVTISVTNVNEAPKFATTTATRSIAENTAASTNIGAVVSATDPDGTTDVNPDDDNVDALTYTLGGTDASSFAIVGTSGQLQTKLALDYETDNSYTVTVSVSDGTDTDSITVTINITNVNEAPKFATTTTTRSIAENAAVGTNIGAAVSATDPDGTTDVNPEDANVDALTYTLGGTDAASFAIVSTSGQLQTKAALDHETKSSYEVTVTASDGGTDTASITVTINISETTPPNVSITVPTGVQNGAFEVTVVFDEAVTGFAQSELVVSGTSGSSITAWNPQDGGTDYKATITPTQTGTAIFKVAAGVAKDAAENQNTAATQQTVQVNLTRPTVSITIPSDAQNGAFEVTVVFSEAVTGFAQSELVVTGTSGASITTWSPQTGGTDYKATITPTSGGTAIFNVAENVAEDTGGNQNTVATQQTVQVDMTSPTVSLTIPSGVQNAPFDVTVVFSEAVTGFEQSELVVTGTSGSTITAWNPQDGGTDYKATITPTSSGTALFNVAANVAADAATNQNTAATQKTVQVNLTRPTVSITIPSDAQNGAFEVTVVFSEAVTGFVQSELVVSGTSGTSITTWSPQTGGTDYKATITPTSGGTAIFNVAANVAEDTGGNQNTVATQQTVQVDMTQPTVSITIPSGVQNAPFDVTVVFSEAVTDFIQSELAVSGTSGSSITAWSPQTGGTDYKATITPTQTGTAIFNVAANVAADAATNQNTAATEKTVQVDRTQPTVSITIPSEAQNGAFEVTVVFSEAVTGFAQSELVVSGTSGSSITTWSPQTGGTDYKATITPTSSGTAIFNVAANVAKDAVENQNTAAPQQTVQVDMTQPTVSLTIPSGVQNAPFDVTVVFSEAVTGFVQSDLAVSGTSGSSITAWNPQDGGTDYKATITPTSSGTAIFNVAANVAADAAENQNTAATQKTVQVNLTRPTVSITIPSDAQNGAFEVTVVFSEAVTGFVQSELVVTGTSGASITAWNPQTGGTDYKATITPTQTGTAIFNVAANVAEDTGSNGNTAASEQTVQVDMTRPTVSITIPSGAQNGAFEVTVVFDEAVTGFVQSELVVTGTSSASITAWNPQTGGTDYRATITPTQTGTAIFNVAASVAKDAAENQNTAATQQTVQVDMTLPAVSITTPSGAQNGAFDVTVVFSEAMTGFVQSELIVSGTSGASITAWNPQTGDTDYKAAITPTQTGTAIFNVSANVAEDAATNGNTAALEQTVQVVLVIPSAVRDDSLEPLMSVIKADGTLYDPDVDIFTSTDPDNDPVTFSVNIDFGEAVSGFVQEDFTINQSGQTDDTLITNWVADVDGARYTAKIICKKKGGVSFWVDGNVAQSVATDAWNTASARQVVSVFYDVGTRDDTHPFVTLTVPPVEEVQTETFIVTVSFNERVFDFTQSDLSIVPRFRQSAPLDEKPPGKVVSIEGWEPDADGMRYTATIALLEARPRESDGKIYDQFWVGFMVQEGVARDAGGNPNGAVGEKLVTVTLPKESDKTSPTVKIVPPDDSPAGAFDAKICFSEVVIGFTESDLQVTGTAGATITDWKIQEDEEDEENVHVFIATLTPTQDGTVTLNVSANVAKDAAGNGNTEATQQSITVAGFDSRPTVRIIASEGVNLDPFQVTIEFSAAVTDFVQSELLCTGTAEMTVSDWSGSGAKYTAMLTPKCGGTLRLDVAKGAANAGTVENPILSRAAPRVTVVILPEDVNHDGVVSILDLFDVAANFGKTVEDPTEINPDVNRDGIVDTTDFNLVKERLKLGTDTLEAANNAPAIGEMFTVLDRATLEKLDPTTLKAQLDRLRAKSDGSLKYLRAIALLESVLAALRPAETLLLANYPNPFNPETWIPYHLANASDVVITIYDMRGSVVRRLELGHQREGYYTSRSRAAYWDGRNHIGERVASDVYFYQLEADNMSLLRKMVILK